TLTLSNLSGAAFGPGGATLAATGTIDDDDQPVVSVTAPPPVTEGNSGTTPARFLVKLSSASADPVTVHYATSNGTATGGSDYTAIAGTATVPAGQTAVAVNVNVTGDTVNEDDETFALTLSGPVGATLGTASATATIGTDDGATLSIGDASVVEGDSGTTAATFTVTLAPATTVGVSVNWVTENRTATAGSDYHAASGTLTFAPGETTKAVTVTVNGDTANEADETFAVKLSGPSATAVLGDPEGIGSIVDD